MKLMIASVTMKGFLHLQIVMLQKEIFLHLQKMCKIIVLQVVL